MTDSCTTTVVLTGASGNAPDLTLFEPEAGASRVEHIPYPGWRRYVAPDFSGETLISELSARILGVAAGGPIRIVGISIGGHFGYAVALRLSSMGREIAGLCVVDTFMMSSSEPSVGWQRRAFDRAVKIIRERRFGELPRFMRSKFWRALLRLAGNRLPALVAGWKPGAETFSAGASLFEEELSMRLLIRETVRWIAALDVVPKPLEVPMAFLRTQRAAADEAAWRRRCPRIAIHELAGNHETLFDPEHIEALRNAFLAATRAWR